MLAEARNFVQAKTVRHCYVAIDQNYIDKNEMEEVLRQADVVWKKVNGFIAYLNKVSD